MKFRADRSTTFSRTPPPRPDRWNENPRNIHCLPPSWPCLQVKGMGILDQILSILAPGVLPRSPPPIALTIPLVVEYFLALASSECLWKTSRRSVPFFPSPLGGWGAPLIHLDDAVHGQQVQSPWKHGTVKRGQDRPGQMSFWPLHLVSGQHVSPCSFLRPFDFSTRVPAGRGGRWCTHKPPWLKVSWAGDIAEDRPLVREVSP